MKKTIIIGSTTFKVSNVLKSKTKEDFIAKNKAKHFIGLTEDAVSGKLGDVWQQATEMAAAANADNAGAAPAPVVATPSSGAGTAKAADNAGAAPAPPLPEAPPVTDDKKKKQ